MRARLIRYVRRRKLIHRGDRVLVALSGGVDSVVLLHLLRQSAKQLGIEIRAAHFDHAMRSDSAADADWVSGLCRAWEVPLLRHRTTRPLQSEADARNERYRFLHSALRDSGATRIATAHHADDQVETVLFRMLRGSGLRGLSGIPVRRGRLIRPLLRASKAELMQYAAQNHIAYRADATNELLEYARNRIRKNVIPALETVRPDSRAALLALARYAARTEKAIHCAILRLEQDVMKASSSAFIELARPVFLEYDLEIRALVLRKMLRRFGIVPGRAETRRIVEFCARAASGAAMKIAGVRIERAFDTLIIERITQGAEADATVAIAGLSGTGRLEVNGAPFDVAWELSDIRRAGAEHFDPGLMATRLELRGWRPGDRIRLPYGGKKLKKLFAERRVPASQRARIPVLVDTNGCVLWVVGVAKAADAAGPQTGPVLNITVVNAEQR